MKILHPSIINLMSNFRSVLASNSRLAWMLKPSKWENDVQPLKHARGLSGAWSSKLPSSHSHLAFPNNVANPCTNNSTSGISIRRRRRRRHSTNYDTCHNVRVWVDFFGDLHQWQNPWHRWEKCDNKEWGANHTNHSRHQSVNISGCNSVKSGGPTSIPQHNP